MTREQFLRNNRGIDNGADLPSDFLSVLYHRIVSDEIQFGRGTNPKTPPGTQQMVKGSKKYQEPPPPLLSLAEIFKIMKETFGVKEVSYLGDSK